MRYDTDGNYVPPKRGFYGCTTDQLRGCLADLQALDDRDAFLDAVMALVADEVAYRDRYEAAS